MSLPSIFEARRQRGWITLTISHDKRTAPANLAAFLAEGHDSPGVLLVIPQDAGLRAVAESLVLFWADGHPKDWANPAAFIPL